MDRLFKKKTLNKNETLDQMDICACVCVWSNVSSIHYTYIMTYYIHIYMTYIYKYVITSKCSRMHILFKTTPKQFFKWHKYRPINNYFKCKRTFSRMDHTLGHSVSLNKFKKTEISGIFSAIML